jgi:hypothetical protein
MRQQGFRAADTRLDPLLALLREMTVARQFEPRRCLLDILELDRRNPGAIEGHVH